MIIGHKIPCTFIAAKAIEKARFSQRAALAAFIAAKAIEKIQTPGAR